VIRPAFLDEEDAAVHEVALGQLKGKVFHLKAVFAASLDQELVLTEPQPPT
jgi:hypothetical protein